VPAFLAELYLSRTGAGDAQTWAARARTAAAELSEDGREVRYLRTTFLPGDETCFIVFEADTAETVAETGRRAGLTFERIVDAVETESSAATG
jgi:hypothetical protein